MDKYFARYERYDRAGVDALCRRSDIRGIVLGDLFCHRRMFQNGIAEFVLLLSQVLASDKTVIYQAPLYVTGRNLDEVKSILALLHGSGKKTYVIVQDFGTAELVAREYGSIGLIWGQLGRVRERRYSGEFFTFLQHKRFVGMETGDVQLAQRMTAYGLTPFFTDAPLHYQTLGRICYLEYQVGHCDPAACHSGCYQLRAENETYGMTIDGYMMGKEYRPVPQADVETACETYGAELICTMA